MALLDNTDLVTFFTDYFQRTPTEQDLVDVEPSFEKYKTLQFNKEFMDAGQIEKATQEVYVPLFQKKISDRIASMNTE